MTEEGKKKKPTLFDFIEENQRLVTVLGVFTALTVFSSNVPLKPFGYVLSFLFMSLTVLLWLELWQKFPSESGSWRLTVFENILPFTVLAVIAYWLIQFRKIWHEFLFLPITIIILSVFTYFLKRFNIFNRFFRAAPNEKKFLRYVFGLAVIFVALFISMLLARPAATQLNRFLDWAYLELSKP
jgi:hypothetical protein